MAKKKGLIYRLTMGKDNLPDFTPDKLPGTRFQLFKDVFFNRFGALVKINLLTLLFCLPAIAWLVIMSMIKRADGALLSYSANIGAGTGLPVTDVSLLGQARAFRFDIQTYLVLIPCIMIAGIGLSGAFYVMRRLVWGEGVSVGGHFFRGIKMNFFPFLWSSLFAGVSFALVMINIGIYNNMTDVHVAFRIIGIAGSIIQFILLFSMFIFLTTQAVTYKLKTWPLIKNSFLFAIALLPTNILILALSVIPFLLFLLPSILLMLVLLLFALFGFSFIILLWTVYAHWAYDRFINDKVEGAVKNRGMYKKTEEDIKAAEERDRKNKNIRFNNPKKRPKKITSIDEGETYTPLTASFSRADLMRLAEEKEAVKRSIDAEYEDAEDGEAEVLPTDSEALPVEDAEITENAVTKETGEDTAEQSEEA